MSNVTISWVTTTPADGDFVSVGASVIRSTRSYIQSAMSQEHFYGDGPSGAHREGSARAFFGPASAISSADTTGRLMATSDTSEFYYVGTPGTYRIGGLGTPQGRMAGNGSDRPLSTTSKFALSAYSIQMNTATTTAANPWSATLPTIYMASVDVAYSGATALISAGVPALVTIAGNGLQGGNVPQVYLWNPDGSTWSGGTVIVNIMALSAVAL